MEACRQYPVAGESAIPEQLRKNAKATQELGYSARLELAEKYGLTRKELAAIGIEGVEKDWEMCANQNVCFSLPCVSAMC